MPELPEVEVVCQGLKPHITGRTIENVWYSGKPLRHVFEEERAADHLPGLTITDVTRRARFALIHVDTHILVTHLGMTGNLGIFTADTPRAKHDHICFLLDNNTELRFNDTRRFGSIQLFTNTVSQDLEKNIFKNLGPEPFSSACSPSYLEECASNRTLSIKNFIMDNKNVVGIGNIYANESLFLAGIHPKRQAKSLTLTEWKKLKKTIVDTLHWAINCGGSTISDFINASGEGGYFQANFKVYGKTGAVCPQCASTLQKEKIGGRASFFCNTCQQ